MKKEILILSLGIILIIITAAIFLQANQSRQKIEKNITTTQPLASVKPEATQIKVWFTKNVAGNYQLFIDPAGQQADTLQIIFKTTGPVASDFIIDPNSRMQLRIKSIQKDQMILLFSTQGESILVDNTKPLGEFILSPGANLGSLILDPARSKLILKGQNFPIYLNLK